MSNEQQPPKKAVTFIKCNCGNNTFIPGYVLGPGKKKPAVIKHVWICARCGDKYSPDDFPKKGEEEQHRESKILLPDSSKLKMVN